jgi:hypothetical protein
MHRYQTKDNSMFSTSLPTAYEPGSDEPRDVKKVPFVELLGQRLQGVVSSGSDIQRVYVSFFEAGTLNYWCSTNNNRPCGGLRGTPCGHLHELLQEAIAQYGVERVVAFLRIPGDPAQIQSARDIVRHSGHMAHESAGDIFSRFLSDLQLLELPADTGPLHTMTWFIP